VISSDRQSEDCSFDVHTFAFAVEEPSGNMNHLKPFRYDSLAVPGIPPTHIFLTAAYPA